MHTGAHLAAALVALLSFTATALLLVSLEPVRAARALENARAVQADGPGVGYDDTPFLPGGTWRVHDSDRPVPPVVGPAVREGRAPEDAVVLFDGSQTSAWHQNGDSIGWQVENGELIVAGDGSIETVGSFGDCQLHLEWATPEEAAGTSQHRGNSGVFLMGRYEIQILDSFANRTYADGQAAALYGQTPPAVNAAREPGAWQSYDIVFEAPRFEGEELLSAAKVTVFHNGVLVHHATKFLGATRHREVATYEAHEPELPLLLQDHGNPIRFRNIWLRRL